MTMTRKVRRVLMTADAVGGVWDYCLDLVRGLAKLGVRVTLAVMGDLSAERRAEAESIVGLELHHGDFKLEWMDGGTADVGRAGEWLLDLESVVRPELIHLNNYAHGCLPWKAPCLVVAHSCVLSWWLAVKGRMAPKQWLGYAELVKRGLLGADAVAAPTRHMLRTIHSLYGRSAPAIVVRNGCDPALFSPGRKQPLVLGAGRVWDEAKNVTSLDKAASNLAWPVKIAGEWRHPCGTSCKPANAEYLGFLPRAALAGHMAKASIYCLPARYEPFGLTVLEAAMSGCALVLGDIGSLRELWNGAALFVDPDDPRELRNALTLLMIRKGLRTRLAREARARALAMSVERMALRYAAVYNLMVGDGLGVIDLEQASSSEIGPDDQGPDDSGQGPLALAQGA
ncbi:glycosyltransferase family 4 protein [Desulfocurvibacter africanus]|uniref:Glycosyl transferase group 1 n=1 Tax=Desulfocurvibacter africanus subsp. africanus str. Walvis Bay TaxID=690850 RepID=F3YZJ3_DESAF|nr:glycosyltransferase family 4 protein [Desulfocurvibacter africanus]EGJ49692.1 glycosyl transferase group 1 [Desulfocurvibacter africanus subsp. africanus str. Walvis Bay]